jgi:hypothetical protein
MSKRLVDIEKQGLIFTVSFSDCWVDDNCKTVKLLFQTSEPVLGWRYINLVVFFFNITLCIKKWY